MSDFFKVINIMKALVTGGAGFIGRWLVKKLLEQNIEVIVLDDLSNGAKENLNEFKKNSFFKGLIVGSITDKSKIKQCFNDKIDMCFHLAAKIDIQESINEPEIYFDVNINGTLNILEEAKKQKCKFIVVGTCMVYDVASTHNAINEEHSLNPLSPYAASKLASEFVAISYYKTYGLPVVIVRPFNTYGPYQKPNMEGGVISIFLDKKLKNDVIDIFGEGTQTRDFLYVEDCVDFIIKAAFNKKSIGEIFNVGFGKSISIKDLALMIINDEKKMKYVSHHHPQGEIMNLICDSSKAKNILNWEPKISLSEGLKKTEEWLKECLLKE